MVIPLDPRDILLIESLNLVNLGPRPAGAWHAKAGHAMALQGCLSDNLIFGELIRETSC